MCGPAHTQRFFLAMSACTRVATAALPHLGWRHDRLSSLPAASLHPKVERRNRFLGAAYDQSSLCWNGSTLLLN